MIVCASNLKHLWECERLLHGLKTDLEFILYWTERTTLDRGRFYSVDESRDFVHSPGRYYGSNMTGLWQHHVQFPFPVVLFLSMGSLFKRCLSGFLLGTQSWSAVDLWKLMLLWPSLFFPKIVLGGQLGNSFYIT